MLSSILAHALKEINIYGHDIFELAHSNPSFYYQIHRTLYTQSDQYLYITMHIPLTSVGGMLAIYRLDVIPLSINNTHGERTRILGLPAYLTVTPNAEYYTELTNAQYLQCDTEHVKMCTTATLLRHRNTLSCAASIYYDIPEKILELSVEQYNGNAKRIDDSARYLVYGVNISATWSLNCPLEKDSARVARAMEPCNTCIIQLPCMCSLSAKEFVIPMRLSDCSVMTSSISTTIVYAFPINLAMYHTFPRDVEIQRITGSSMRYDRMWSHELPTFHVVESNWTDVMTIDDEHAWKLNKLTIVDTVYATKADHLWHKIRDMSDFSYNNLNDIKNNIMNGFGGKIFNVVSITGGVTGMMVMAILACICSMYNCY